MKSNYCKISIYYPLEPTFRVDDSIEEYELDNYRLVLEQEFINDSQKSDIKLLDWYWSAGNSPLSGFRACLPRSLSVGDIIVINDHAYICASIGWNRITLK